MNDNELRELKLRRPQTSVDLAMKGIEPLFRGALYFMYATLVLGIGFASVLAYVAYHFITRHW